jgi:glutamate-ammonia-ligase adenylyltransferase
LWERQILTRARVVHGDADFGQEVLAAVTEGLDALCWQPAVIDEMLAMRQRLETSRGKRDLKRGSGGLMDVEFLVEMFQLKYGRDRPELRQVNVWQALTALETAGLVTADEQQELRDGYDFLLRAQSQLRNFHNRSTDELPEAASEIDKLGRRLGYENGVKFQTALELHTSRVHDLFLRLMQRERTS